MCQRCPLVGSKPGTEPAHLAPALNLAAELSELERIGILHLVYRNGLNALEVAVMRGAQRGKDRHEEEVERRRAAKQADEERKRKMKESLSRES